MLNPVLLDEPSRRYGASTFGRWNVKHASLFVLVEAYEKIEHPRERDRIALWDAFEIAEPELARDLLEVIGSPSATARWFVASLPENGKSPARAAAEGTLSWHPATASRPGAPDLG
jgi:hypothetical protein